MGRKIPAKKHRGVKDPLEQQARRFKSLQGKINSPPRDPDEQPVPRSLLRLLARPAGEDRPRKRARKAPAAAGGGAGGASAVSRLRRLPGEPARAFSRRIAGAVRTLLTPADQAPPDLDEEEDSRGRRMEEFRARRRRRAARKGAAGDPAGAGDGAKAPSRAARLALRRRQKEARRAEARPAPAERLPFGEQAHAPPQLAPPRRAPPAHTAGGRDLLLTALLRPAGASGASGGAGGRRASAAGGASAGTADAERRERARLQAVAAYRMLRGRTRS